MPAACPAARRWPAASAAAPASPRRAGPPARCSVRKRPSGVQVASCPSRSNVARERVPSASPRIQTFRPSTELKSSESRRPSGENIGWWKFRRSAVTRRLAPAPVHEHERRGLLRDVGDVAVGRDRELRHRLSGDRHVGRERHRRRGEPRAVPVERRGLHDAARRSRPPGCPGSPAPRSPACSQELRLGAVREVHEQHRAGGVAHPRAHAERGAAVRQDLQQPELAARGVAPPASRPPPAPARCRRCTRARRREPNAACSVPNSDGDTSSAVPPSIGTRSTCRFTPCVPRTHRPSGDTSGLPMLDGARDRRRRPPRRATGASAGDCRPARRPSTPRPGRRAGT